MSDFVVGIFICPGGTGPGNSFRTRVSTPGNSRFLLELGVTGERQIPGVLRSFSAGNCGEFCSAREWQVQKHLLLEQVKGLESKLHYLWPLSPAVAVLKEDVKDENFPLYWSLKQDPGPSGRGPLPCAKSCPLGDVIFYQRHKGDRAFSVSKEAGDKLPRATHVTDEAPGAWWAK